MRDRRNHPTLDSSRTVPLHRPLATLAFAAALLALATPAALAGGARTVIVLTPPQPVTAPPTGYIPQPLPSYPPAAAAPVPIQPLPPQVTYFTPPQAVPVIVPNAGGHGR
jgi:hypothetical protein